MDYKQGQEKLQIGAAYGMSNMNKEIANWGKSFKLGQGLQVGAKNSLLNC